MAHEQGKVGIFEGLSSFLQHFAAYLSVRMRLIGIEGREAAAQGLKLLILAVFLIILLGMGWILVCVGAAFWMAEWFESPDAWTWIITVLALVHLIGVAVIGLIMRSMFRTPLFSQTLDEFRKDQEWLNQAPGKNPS